MAIIVIVSGRPQFLDSLNCFELLSSFSKRREREMAKRSFFLSVDRFYPSSCADEGRVTDPVEFFSHLVYKTSSWRSYFAISEIIVAELQIPF
ncbi:hypothetical protein Nepgr_030180 [Nepenthes gracilis]|uniref:Uncharacterized protein n=1 Tax=Nepenthes gracilis TaxID=150966 RepID=A0AAD3TGN2_NEPGR|nr:hypothetical protein Nepgr_030180 [Nepenthes gracilis]